MPQRLQASGDPGRTAALAPQRQAGRLAWVLLGVAVVLMASSLILAFTGGETWNAKFATMPVALTFALVGALIAARTGNRLGWLFLAAGLADAGLVGEAFEHRGCPLVSARADAAGVMAETGAARVLLVHGLPRDAEDLGDLLPGPPLLPRVVHLECLELLQQPAEGGHGPEPGARVRAVGGGRQGGCGFHSVNLG
jgi:hypothetical protein